MRRRAGAEPMAPPSRASSALGLSTSVKAREVRAQPRSTRNGLRAPVRNFACGRSAAILTGQPTETSPRGPFGPYSVVPRNGLKDRDVSTRSTRESTLNGPFVAIADIETCGLTLPQGRQRLYESRAETGRTDSTQRPARTAFERGHGSGRSDHHHRIAQLDGPCDQHAYSPRSART